MKGKEKTGRLKRYFLQGLAVIVPAAVTIWIFIWIYHLIQKTIGWVINKGIALIWMELSGLSWSDVEGRMQVERFWVQGLGSLAGFLIALVIIFILGIILANVIGRKLWRSAERLIGNLPLVRQVYPYVKQVSDFLFSQSEQTQFISRVVAFEYPRKGIWTVGFVTGEGMKWIADGKEIELLSILVPTAPSPLSGYMILIAKEDTVPLDMKVEEALRFVISDGVITPPYVIDEARRGKG
jgi:uncharacterized membrane protein